MAGRVRRSAEEAERRRADEAARIPVDELVARLGARDLEQRREAAWTLSLVDDPRAPDALVELVDDGEQPGVIRRAGLDALVRRGDARADAIAEGALGAEAVELRAAALEAVASLRGEAALDRLEAGLRDDSRAVRAAAVTALERVGTPTAAAALRRRAEEEGFVMARLMRDSAEQIERAQGARP